MRLRKVFLIGLLVLGMFAPTVYAANEAAVNMNVVNAKVRDVLTSLAAIGQKNLVIDDAVVGSITIQLKDVPFDKAIDLVAKAKGLGCQIVGDIMIVGPAEQMNKGFSDIHIFKLKYAKASEAAQTLGVALGDSKASEQSKTASGDKKDDKQGQGMPARMRVDQSTNSIIFFGTLDEVAKISSILNEIDIRYKQISLEAKVVAISKQASKSLGIEWEWAKIPQYPDYEREEITTKTPVTQPDGTIETVETTTHGWKVIRKPEQRGIIQFGRTPEGFPYEFNYSAKLNALITKGDADILAKPKITTINGKEAEIKIGQEVPIPTISVNNNISTTGIIYKSCGIILKYTPLINDDGYITALVHTEVSAPVLVPELKAYKFITRSADTEVRMKDGETMVIGGLIGAEEMKSMSKVPFLGDIPIFGRIFQSTSKSKEETEVIIFLTAHVVK